jgi:hypothetical protein
MGRTSTRLLLFLAVAAAPLAAAAEEVSLPPHFVGLVGTTIVERPQGSAMAGPAGLWNLRLGLGGMVTPRLSFELDGGPAFSGVDYAAFELTTGLVHSISERFYGSARLLVGVDPPLAAAALPGFGASFRVSSALHLVAEVDARIGFDGSYGAVATTGFVFEG